MKVLLPATRPPRVRRAAFTTPAPHGLWGIRWQLPSSYVFVVGAACKTVVQKRDSRQRKRE